MVISKVFEFSSAHHLPGHKVCGLPHGHNYSLEPEVSGPVCLDGMVLDFFILKEVINEALVGLDHRDLNDTLNMPTAENLAILLGRKISTILKNKGLFVELVRLKLWETSHNYVVAYPEDWA